MFGKVAAVRGCGRLRSKEIGDDGPRIGRGGRARGASLFLEGDLVRSRGSAAAISFLRETLAPAEEEAAEPEPEGP